jgi:hypothetical protein
VPDHPLPLIVRSFEGLQYPPPPPPTDLFGLLLSLLCGYDMMQLLSVSDSINLQTTSTCALSAYILKTQKGRNGIGRKESRR